VGGYGYGGVGPFTRTDFVADFAPGSIVQIAPTGTISTRRPTLTWQADRDSCQYGIWLGTAGGTTLLQNWYPSSGVCTGGTCQLPLTSDLTPGGYSWYIGGYCTQDGPWTSTPFTVQ
jgi:hypothetical protein